MTNQATPQKIQGMTAPIREIGGQRKPESELKTVHVMVTMTRADHALLTHHVDLVGGGLATLLRESAKREARAGLIWGGRRTARALGKKVP